MTRAIIHIDMDAFYASVEQRDAPNLRGKPVIVGGDVRRGVVLAASYEVRPFGVRSAIPMARAIKLAPRAIIVPPRFGAYVEASEAVFRIFERYTPLIEPLSLDEAFLDVTGSLGLFGRAATIASSIREVIRNEVGLPASAGIAEVKFVAKIASDVAKPDGQREVLAGASRAFLAPLPVGRLWGVGPKTEEMLKRCGLSTIGQVAEREREWLASRLGAVGNHFWELARGIDERRVVPDRDAQSISAQDTFEEDLLGEEALRPRIHSQALRVGQRLRKAHLKAKCVQLAIKYEDFTQLTRRTTLPAATDDGQEIYRQALVLLQKVALGRPVRRTGVSGQQLEGEASQLGLFSAQEPPTKQARLNEALDAIASRFGNGAVRTADLSSDDPDGIRDGFYLEDKRHAADQAHRAGEAQQPRVERDEEMPPDDEALPH